MAAAEIRYGPQPVTLRFLQRAQQLTPALAEGIIAKLREAGWLDEVGFMAGAACEGARSGASAAGQAGGA